MRPPAVFGRRDSPLSILNFPRAKGTQYLSGVWNYHESNGISWMFLDLSAKGNTRTATQILPIGRKRGQRSVLSIVKDRRKCLVCRLIWGVRGGILDSLICKDGPPYPVASVKALQDNSCRVNFGIPLWVVSPDVVYSEAGIFVADGRFWLTPTAGSMRVKSLRKGAMVSGVM